MIKRERQSRSSLRRMKEQTFHLENEISHNADLAAAAAAAEQSVAFSEIEAQMAREQDESEILRLPKELNETQERGLCTAQSKAFQEELKLAKIEAQNLKMSFEEANKKWNELESDKDTAEEEIVRLKERVSTL
mmetsp:Transcript_495/g.1158  ORF Transcript_495/g.1158 Transcript_495/m.1158 type:complete len:134 (+) Transcript_495:1435-1836(+)